MAESVTSSSDSKSFFESFWEWLWFTPASPYAVGIGRIVLCLLCLDWLWNNGPWQGMTALMVTGHMPRDLYKPISFIKALSLPPPTPGVLKVLCWLALDSALLTLVGLFSQISSKVLALTMVYLLCLPNCWIKVNHGYHVLGLMLIVLAFARSGDWLSFDAWLAKRKAKHNARSLPQKSWHYAWPSQAWRLSFALMLLFASYSKMTRSGLVWITGPNLRNVILEMHHNQRGADPSSIAMWVAGEPWRWKTAAAAAVLTQALFIGILFARKLPLHLLFLGAGVGFLVGLRVLMDLPNPVLEIQLLLLIDYDGIIQLIQKLRVPIGDRVDR